MARQKEDESKTQPVHSRRNALRIGGITVASIIGTSTLSSVSAQTESEPNTDFDPESRQEVAEFLSDARELPKEEQQRYTQELHKNQKQAIGDLYFEADWEYETVTKETVQPLSDYSTQTVTTVAEGTVTLVGVVYRHIQILTWDYNGDDYKNVSQELEYELPGIYATYQGTTEDTINEGETAFTATLSAEYAAEVAGVTRGGEATIVVEGDEGGNHEVLVKNAPTG